MARTRTQSNLEVAREKMYRDLVFECAEHAFAEQGYAKTTMNDIAAEAGISLKTLYAVSLGKKELYSEIRRRRGTEFLEYMLAGLARTHGALARLDKGVHVYVAFLLEHRDFFRIQLREGRSWGLGPTGDGIGEWRRGLEMQNALLRDGVAEGVFLDGDLSLLAASATAMLQVQLAGILEREEHRGDKSGIDAEVIGAEIAEILRRLIVKPDLAH
ncbi:MAG: TetR/AcrR family transcriptional regulator [Deltaproteobacteria bacterium]